MTANINPTTGIAYGVIAANNVPYLVDDIMTHGTDLAYKNELNDLANRLKTCDTLDDVNIIVVDEYNGDPIDDRDFDPETVAADLLSDIDHDGEPHYEYETGGFKYLLSGIYLFVCESPFVAHCRPCSPCFPNAGDLDSITEVNGGTIAYCVDPDDINPDMEDREGYDINIAETPNEVSKRPVEE